LSGSTLRLGGGYDWCPACHTKDPDEEACPHDAYETHPIVEGEFDADATVTTGSEQYRGNGEIPFEYESEPRHDDEPTSFDDRVPSWHVKSVTVDGDERPASAGNGIDMVTLRDERQELAGDLGLDSARKYRCDCGVAAYGDDMIAHLRGHGLEAGDVDVGADEIVEVCRTG
jgi:hypothetical protein